MNISALNESGQPIDWWFIYKVPQLNKGINNDAATGYEYVYYDSAIDKDPDPKKRFVATSPFVLNSDKGALNLTLNSIFVNFDGGTADFRNATVESTVGWVLYNDEMPLDVGEHDDGTKGHSKGVIAFDTKTKTAFWLLHSWPKFLDPEAKEDPTPKYGQTYMCISMSLDTANNIAAMMIDHQEPQLFFCNPADLPIDSALYKLIKPTGSATKYAPLADKIDLVSAANMPFSVIAKNREWNKDFWNELVGPALDDDMDDETWIRGPIPPIADSDGIHKTFDIKYINMGPLGLHWAWPETHDHAKWGITLQNPWICIGDINRMISQRKRGGGTIAFQNRVLWTALSKSGLTLAPPGSTRTEAHALIAATQDPQAERPLKTTL